MRHRVNR